METTEVVFALILLGVLQGCMQGIMFYNAFARFDKYLPKGVKWFSFKNNNRDIWAIWFLGKKYKPFRVFPFVSFTDFFHVCHLAFGFTIGAICAQLINPEQQMIKILTFVGAAIVYSTAFELQLRLTKKISK